MIRSQPSDSCSTDETCDENEGDYSEDASCLSDQESQSEEVPGLLVKRTSKEYADEEERDINEHPEYDNDLCRKATTSRNVLQEEQEDNTYMNKFASILKKSTDKYGGGSSSTKRVSIKEATNLQESLEVEKEWIESHGMFTGSFAEGQTTQNFVNQINGFYEEMNAKLKLLKNNSVLKRARECDLYDLPDESGDFRSREMDFMGVEDGGGNVAQAQKAFSPPSYQSTYAAYFDAIGEMDSQLADSSSELAAARSERLRTQEELCSQLSRSTAPEHRDRATELFLELCAFERTSSENRDPDLTDRPVPVSDRTAPCMEVNGQEREAEGERQRGKASVEAEGRNFVRRNVELAKQGFMATCSLTDEEKQKLEGLLGDIDEMINEGEDNDRQLVKINQQDTSDTEEEEDGEEENKEEEGNYFGNAFKMSQIDKSRLEEINEELKRFSIESGETSQEKIASEEGTDQNGENNNLVLTQKLSKGVKNKNVILSDKNCFMLEQNLKEVEKKLKEIEELYNRDEALKQKLSEQRQMLEQNRQEEELDENFDLDDVSKEEENEESDVTKVVIGSNESCENVSGLTIN